MPKTKTTKTDAPPSKRGIRTVGELIEVLRCFNPALPVLRDTDEFGASGIESCRLVIDAAPDLNAFVFIGPREDEEEA